VKSGEKDAIISGRRRSGEPGDPRVMDCRVYGRLDGAVVGEKITRAASAALAERRALVIVSASAARACRRAPSHHADGEDPRCARATRPGSSPYVSVITDATTVASAVFARWGTSSSRAGRTHPLLRERVTSGTSREACHRIRKSGVPARAWLHRPDRAATAAARAARFFLTAFAPRRRTAVEL